MTMGMTWMTKQHIAADVFAQTGTSTNTVWHKSARTWEQEVEKVDTCVLCACAVTATSAAYHDLKE